MRMIKSILLVLIGLALLIVVVANIQPATLRLLPDDLAALAGFQTQVTVPLFVVVLASVGVGLLIGYLFEYLRETKHRTDANRQRRHAKTLEREIEKMRNEKTKGGDDVIALLEDVESAR